jgi:prepilin-type processing-associated H-X9-DG protein
VRSYGMNSFVGWTGAPYRDLPTSGYRTYLKTAEITDPGTSMLFVFQEIHPQSICRPFFGVTMDPNSFYHVPGNFHDKSTTLSFADGHVERHTWVDSRTFNPPKTTDWHAHDYLTPGNPDLAWLNQHSSARQTR